ncbi:MAG: DUF2157 domain-containing protein [Fimbriimonadales bacterium]
MSGAPPPRAASNFFRAELARILPGWEVDGVLTHEEAARLSDQYHLSDFTKPRTVAVEGPDQSTLAIRVAFLIGGLLFGCGVIAFVATNWAALPSFVKAGLLNLAVIGLYGGGYWFWFKKNMPALGHSLVFAGAIAFGADLGLMAQGFNISLPYYAGYGAWACGVLLLAAVLRSVPLVWLSMFSACIWLFGGALMLPADSTLERFIAAAFIVSATGLLSGFVWMHVISLLFVGIGSATFVSMTTEDIGWAMMCLLGLSAFLATLSSLIGTYTKNAVAPWPE